VYNDDSTSEEIREETAIACLNTLRMGHDGSHDLNPMHRIRAMRKLFLNTVSFILA
jgi:hypothetical protein